MEFKKFGSLVNAYNQKIVNKLVDGGYNNTSWLCVEKIHGANFGIHADYTKKAADLRFSRRSAFLEDGEEFYSHSKIKASLEFNLIRLVNQLRPNKVNTLSIYGEIFGGSFYGEQVQGCKQVQSEVQYSPKTEFAAFALKLNGEYLPALLAYSLLDKAGFMTAPIIARCDSLEEALAISNEFESLVPSHLGYEAKEGNTCEGVVIEPAKEIISFNGEGRLVLKNKNSKFSEKKAKPAKVQEPMSEFAENLFKVVSTYVSEQRLSNVISKELEVTQKDFGHIMGLLVQDVITEFEADYDTTHISGYEMRLKLALEDEWKRFSKELQKLASQVVRKYWIETF